MRNLWKLRDRRACQYLLLKLLTSFIDPLKSQKLRVVFVRLI